MRVAVLKAAELVAWLHYTREVEPVSHPEAVATRDYSQEEFNRAMGCTATSNAAE
jgi:hypothetical protein